MNVGINTVFRQFTACGHGQYLARLLPALARVDSSIRYIELSPPDASSYAEGRLRKPLSEALWEFFGIGSDCRRQNVDILHNPYWTAPLFPHPKTVVTVHDIVPIHPDFPMYRASNKSKAYYSILARTTGLAQAIIADSQTAATDIKTALGIDSRKLHVVYLAPDERHYARHSESEIEALRRKYQVDRPYILCVASGFDHRKNIKRLVEAYTSEVSRLGSKATLLITGDLHNLEYPASRELRGLVGNSSLHDMVKFTGYVADEDMPLLYQGAEVYVSASLYEGGGLSVMDAMAAGTPMLLANRSCLPEVAGDSALYFDPTDRQDLAKRLVQLMEDNALRLDLGHKAEERSRQYSWDRTAQETVQIYKHIRGGA